MVTSQNTVKGSFASESHFYVEFFTDYIFRDQQVKVFSLQVEPVFVTESFHVLIIIIEKRTGLSLPPPSRLPR